MPVPDHSSREADSRELRTVHFPAMIPQHSIVPAPAAIDLVAGEPFVFDQDTRIVADPALPDSERLAEYLAGLLRPSTGFGLHVTTDHRSDATNAVVLQSAPEAGETGGEAYTLEVAPGRITLAAAEPAGAFRGVQTLRQLLPAAVEAHESTFTKGPWTVPACRISDRPRFGWRGAMLDVARHFLTVHEVKQFIDAMALYKLNVLHLHLTDDQGWRIEIDAWPELARTGGRTQVGGGGGGFYTRQEYAELVRYAQDRYITLVPEIDVPGHVHAALASVPDLNPDGVAPLPYGGIRVGFSALPVDADLTYRLLADVLREVAEMTPGPYIHIGGDEVESLPEEAYVAFIERVQEMVARTGKQMVGWEEIARARLRPGTVVQHWRSDSVTQALGHGAKLVLSPASKVYLDMKYDAGTELGLPWAGYVEVRDAYEWDPATLLTGVEEHDVLGVEAPLWSETLRNITAAFYMAFPRLPALAEVGWTPAADRDWEDFRRRLAAHAARWRLLGINYHRSPQIEWDR
jgi:hexosaminidase